MVSPEPGTHADDPRSRSRFVLECEVTGRLEHPGIVPVYALGTYADGRPFYVMRFIRGDSLKDAIARFHGTAASTWNPGERVLALRKLLRRFIDVCNAVAYAHSGGVLHRDLKPSNVMLGRFGETLVVDWGLAQGQRTSISLNGQDFREEVRVHHAPIHLAAEAVLDGMALEEAHSEAPQPAQIVAKRSLACAAVVFAKVHIQNPVHRLDGPMTTDRLTESLAAEIVHGIDT